MKNLKSFINSLRSHHPQALMEVTKNYKPALEVCSFLGWLERQRRYQAILFQRVDNLYGEPSGYPLAINLFASRELCALALDLPLESSGMALSLEYERREASRIRPVKVAKQEAPVKEVIEEIDLGKFPVLTHHLADAAPYVTMSLTGKDLKTDAYNSSFHRGMVQNGKSLAIFFEARHLWALYSDYEAQGRPMPVAYVIGHHPAYYLGTCSLVPIDVDEYEVIGGLLGEPLRLVASESWGEDFLVPADAEIVIEGVILPKLRVPEGPFGDITGHYGGKKESPLMEVTAVTHRRDACFMDIFAGHREHRLLGAIPKEAGIYSRVKAIVPGVKAVTLPLSGAGRFHCYISIEKKVEGEAKLAAMAALSSSELIKHVIVVDDDIDVYDDEEVLWAVATRAQADQDVEIMKRVKGSRLDSSAPGLDYGAKMIIDATRDLSLHFPERIQCAPYKE